MRYSQGDGVDTSLSRLVLYPRVVYSVVFLVLPAARPCAAWNDNNKGNVCTPSIPARLKRPPPSKTISPHHPVWDHTEQTILNKRQVKCRIIKMVDASKRHKYSEVASQ